MDSLNHLFFAKGSAPWQACANDEKLRRIRDNDIGCLRQLVSKWQPPGVIALFNELYAHFDANANHARTGGR